MGRVMGVSAGVLILSYYSVIAGWTITYIPKAFLGEFVEPDAISISKLFDDFVANPVSVILAHTIFMVINYFIIASGVKGTGKSSSILNAGTALAPIYFVYLFSNFGSFMDGVKFMFTPNFNALNWDGVLTAMGLACFTPKSIGMGAIMAYGAYLPQETSITNATVSVVIC